MTTAFGDVCFWGNSGHWAMSALPPKVGKKNLHVAKLVRAPHKDRLSQLRTKESDVCHETGQQPLGRGARPKELRLPTRCFEQSPATPRRASCRSWVATEQSRPRPRESQRLTSRIRLAGASAANPSRQARNNWASGPAHGSPY